MSLIFQKDRPGASSSYFETYPRQKTRNIPSSANTDPVFPPKQSHPSLHSSHGPRSPPYSSPQPRLRAPSPDMDPPIDARSPGLRYSGSSSATHILDTPPHSPPSVFNVNIVSAPIPDVGTMDALVDGMNNFDHDDILYASSLHRHEQSKIFPPCDTPTKSIPSIVAKPHSPPIAHPARSRIPRPKSRKVDYSSSSKVFPPESSVQPSEPLLRPTLSGQSSAPPLPPAKKAFIPSISDIVRAHAVDLTPAKSLDSRDSFDLISRSSIDTIAEEVQHTLRQPIPDSTPSRSPGSSFIANCSNTPDVSISSSSQTATETVAPEVLQSEAIATYIRSARLTKLVKIPRPLQVPLQVSLSDLGDPNGRPLVVFLGLGAVRYIMGLYDEMAEILGLRIITIDR
jgi:hypothetical protein